MFSFLTDVGVMRLDRLTTWMMILLLLLSFFIVNTVNADDPIDTFVDATFDIEVETATYFKIAVTMNVNQITVFGKTYNSAEIQTLASSMNTSDMQDMGAIKFNLIQLLDNQITATFEEDSIGNLGKRPTYKDGAFHHDYTVNLTSSFFGMDETVNADDFVNGILDISAWVNYSLDLQAETGWNNTYNILLGEDLDYQRTNGILSGNSIIWSLKNGDGSKPSRTAEIQIKKKAPTTEKTELEDISLEFELDSKEPETVSLTNNIILKNIDIRHYDVVPSFISNLDFMPSDGVRLFIDNGFFSWNNVYQKTIKPLEEKMKSTIEESVFNQTLDITFNWDEETTTDSLTPYEINNMNNDPAIKAILKDSNVDLQIYDITSRAVFGLINSGAEANITKEDINFGDDLNKIGYDYNVTLYLPDGLYLDGLNVYTWNETTSYFGEFESEIAPSYDEQEKNTIIVIEVTSTDLNLLSFFTGKTEFTFGIDFKETSNYNVTELPEEFSLPEKVSLNYLNSDALRLCIEEKAFSQDDVDVFLNSEKEAFEQILRNMLSGLDINANVNKGNFEKSLQWDGDISNMDAETPVEVDSSAHSSYPIPFELSLLPPKFNVPALSFNFKGIEDNDVTYKIIFPNGISVDVNDPLDKAEVKETKAGRQYIEITFTASESNLTAAVSCKLTPSALFILGILTPCIVSIIIAILLVVVIFIIRRKRKKKKAATTPMIEEDEELTGYEDEDFYVPPPPGSK